MTTGQHENELSTVEEIDGEELQPVNVSGRVAAFLDKADTQDREPIFYLYKYENYMSGETKAFLKKFEDCDPPDEDTIGRMYGGGRYLLMLSIAPPPGKRKGLTRLYRFRVHPMYDDMRESSRTPAAVPNLPTATGPTFMDAVGMFERLFALALPLFNRPKDENLQDILRENYSSMNAVMQEHLLQNSQLLTDYQRNIADLGEAGMYDSETEPEEKPGIIEQFGPLINQWIPVLLGGGAKAQAASAVVNSVPQVQQILGDKIQLRKIIAYLDQERGPAETDKILAALKIQRNGQRRRIVRRSAAPPPPPAPAKKPVKRVVRKKKAAAPA